MTELGKRSGSQILRTFLPDQTADLRGKIYRVVEWSSPEVIQIDTELVRASLLREISAFRMDGGVGQDLRQNAPLEVVELNEQRGVLVERFPEVWLCQSCNRIGKSAERACKCGQRRWGQLHFVGVHECGAIKEPWIKRCAEHDDVRIVIPRSAKAADIAFVCPMCSKTLAKGFGFNRSCDCGQGTLKWNVHKSRTVYVPHGMVLINPPRPEHRERLKLTGGARKALVWTVGGITVPRPEDVVAKPTREEFVAKVIATGMLAEVVEEMADLAEAKGQLAAKDEDPLEILSAEQREAAEREAVDIAMALAESHMPITALRSPTQGDALDRRYELSYPKALHGAGLHGINLVDRFPILNVMYGYTRGDGGPDACRLVPFRRKREGYRLHGNLAETEALFVRLDPLRLARWLTARGHRLAGWRPDDEDPTVARVAVLASSVVPMATDDQNLSSVGADVLRLVHTYAHRFIRQTAVFSGIERDSLSEYLVPGHLGFFVYAAARGDFVLGGMQAVFESNLDDLLRSFVDAEHRCPLDPGCMRGSGACGACIHLGEPSCRLFNRFLDRNVLFGRDGYLRGIGRTLVG